MLSFRSCQNHGSFRGLLSSFCLHTLLLSLEDALTLFLYQFQVSLEDEHEIDWILCILFLYSDQKLGG